MIKPELIAHTWKNIRKEVLSLNPALSKAIDDIDPDDSFTLYEAIYPYGTVITKRGEVFIPNKSGQLVKLDDESLDKQIREDFAFTKGDMPPGILLENAIQESLEDSQGRWLPLAMVYPGSIFSLWKWLDENTNYHPIRIFNITAGANSLFMLPNIGDLSLHKNLRRELNIRQPAPKNLEEQWSLFKEITNNPETNCNWRTRLLFLPGKWMEKIKSDPAWQSLYLQMLKNLWYRSAYERNQMFFDFALSCAQANRNLRPNPYLTDTVRHLIMIALGSAAGFGIARDDISAPVSLLQDIYVNCYGLKGYIPTFIQPAHFKLCESKEPVYYSLQLPTTLEFSPKSRKLSTTLNDLREVRHILTTFFDEIQKGKLSVEDTVLGTLAEKVAFRFYHTKPDIHEEVTLTEQLLETHPELADYPKAYGEREVALNGAFIRGCIQIANK